MEGEQQPQPVMDATVTTSEGVSPLDGSGFASAMPVSQAPTAGGEARAASEETGAPFDGMDNASVGVPAIGEEASSSVMSAVPGDVTAMAGVAGDVVSSLGVSGETSSTGMDYSVQPTMNSVAAGEEANAPAVPSASTPTKTEPDEYEGEAGEPAPPPAANGDADLLREQQDRYLPIANVSRIMKMALPSQHGKIARDAKECVQEAVSEFVSFITSEASDRCLSEKRKTITSDDIIVAMQTLGFDNYIEPLRQYIANYRYAMNKSKGNKRSADESKETDGTESGFPFAADNAAAPSDPDLADQSASLMDGGGSAAAGDATTAGYAQQDPSLFAGMD